MDAQAVRILVRAKLRDGRLPVYKISRLLAGPGRGNMQRLRHTHHEGAVGDRGHLGGRQRPAPSSSRRLFPDLECGATYPLASMDSVESYCGSVVLAARGSRLR
jgi:hypothetical protein